MEKVIYQDKNGLYFVEYDSIGQPKKVYCDQDGNPLVIKEENTLEIFQQEDGAYYYVAYNELGEAYKVPCDENGNEIIEVPYVSPIQPFQNRQQASYNGQTQHMAGATGTAVNFPVGENQNYQANTNKKSSSKGFKSLVVALLSGLLVIFGGYFAYSYLSGNSSSFNLFGHKVNMEGYMVDVKFIGKDGDGEVEAKISAIPNVTVSDSSRQKAIDDLLKEAEISYSKQTALKNGEQISISINVDEQAAKKEGITLEGTFKEVFTVAGLTESSKNDSEKDSSSESKESDLKKESSEESKKELEYKQVYNTGRSGLLMRTGPSQSYSAITTLFDGTPVKILEYDGAWARVDYNGKQGWMHTGYLR